MGHQHVKPFKPSKAPRRYGWRETWPVWAVAGFFVLVIAVCLVQEYRVYGPQKSDVTVSALRPGQDLHVLRLNLQRPLVVLNRSVIVVVVVVRVADVGQQLGIVWTDLETIQQRLDRGLRGQTGPG